MADIDTTGAPPAPPRTIYIRRHSIVTRLTHWLNVLCLSLLLMSGMQIFNAHPALYWGQYGANADPSWLQISATDGDNQPYGTFRIGGLTIPTTGVLGASKEDGEWTERAFPAWATIPSYQDLAAGRRWHFFFAWLFVFNGLIYLLYGFIAGHFRRDLAPSGAEVSPRNLWHEIIEHARLRFPKGEKAKRYNALQKLSYLIVIFILLPLMLATGLTMSPGIDAGYPFLLDIFGGRQTARGIHFITAWTIVLFVLVHVAMVILSGLWNNMRSMVTGRYAIRREGEDA
ncbi:cytochrome b/b6 domain-containing protein [Rhizobium sp. LEGMi198b]|uniref:cytochrome b/b6 domain-containing protein n=1 Tax=unclassified Rhizobium TaxID=2613769 RepID=UPI000CDF51BC|nr:MULTISPECIES: cytochrome b/b6 domain-containing protein [Rhizobium]AVA23443.1 cytochrome b561 protein [Rhizobium sp. NXC24]MDK4739563.1 cytochrome b/b6 domain-containing protein [Rhizobium sp. CNPSo 3464]UWU20790.1 cytochrome b/b6 domain-containing protein [Rhizobium tropici]WFU01600.1 cytochrome b/b6 domain-containing protein [Rhizobium sp. CB3171]